MTFYEMCIVRLLLYVAQIIARAEGSEQIALELKQLSTSIQFGARDYDRL